MDAKKKKIIGGIIAILAIIIILILLFKDRSNEKQFTIAFDTAGAGSIADIEVDKNGKITKPKDPVKEGYIFDGWYLNDEEFDFDTKITENIELEAKWSKATYTVTVKFNNGETINETVEYKDTLDLKTPTKEGYKFIGWYVDGKEFNLDTEITHNLTIEAKWEKIKETVSIPEVKTAKYTVEHYLMDTTGNYSSVPYLIQELEGKEQSVIAVDTKEFLGFTSPKKETLEVKDGALIKYYYERNKYSLTVTGDKGIAKTTGTGTYYYEEEISLGYTLNDGYKFASYSDNLTKMPAKDVKITVKTSPKEDTPYTIEHYYMNLDGNYDDVTPEITKAKGTTDSKATIIPKTKTGFTYVENKENITINGNGKTIVKAYYERNKYDLTVTGDKGIAKTTGTGTYYYEEEVPVTATLNNGYSFAKWSNDTTDLDLTYEMTASDKQELKATTTAILYNIDIDYAGGTAENKKTYTIEDDFTLNKPTKEGYKFSHWLINGEKDTTGRIVNRYGDLEIIAVYVESKTTHYSVEHYFMNLDGTYENVSPIVEDNLQGTTNEQPSYTLKNELGFEFDSETTGEIPNISANGKTVVKLYYKRLQYNLKLEKDDHIAKVEGEGKYYYGATVTITATPEVGYDFDSWSNGDKNSTTTYVITAEENQTLTATSTPKTNTKYVVKHVLMDTLGKYDDENPYLTETLEGTTDSTVSPKTLTALDTETGDIKGFIIPEKQKIQIKADGTTELVYHYERKTFDLVVSLGTHSQGLADVLINNESYNEFIENGGHFNHYQVYYQAKLTIEPQMLEGYEFKNWIIEGLTKNEDNTYTVGLSNIYIEAVCEQNIFTVNYHLEEGSLPENEKNTYEIPYGSFAPDLKPVYEGHKFIGWYTEPNFENLFSFTTKITKDYDLYGKWDVEEETLVFETNGGSKISPKKIPFGDEINISDIKNPTKTGYTFEGWYNDIDLQDKFVNNTKLMPSTGWKLYAKWTPNPYKVKFEGNGNDGGTAMEDQDFTYDVPEHLKSNTYTKTGYHFVGWEDAINKKVYKDTDEVKNLVAEGDITLKAKWEANPYTIEYYGIDGTLIKSEPATYDEDIEFESEPEKKKQFTITYNYNYGSNQTEKEKVNAKFVCWTLSDNGNGDCVADKNLTDQYNGKVKLYSKWDATTKNINKTLSRTGYKFIGWSTQKSGEAIKNANDYPISDDIKLYALWNENHATITYHGNNEYITNKTQTFTQNLKYTDSIELSENQFYYTINYDLNYGDSSSNPAQIQNGFKYWSDTTNDNNGEYLPTALEEKLKTENDIKIDLYAIWDDKISFDLDTPERNGYVFGGWSTDSDSAKTESILGYKSLKGTEEETFDGEYDYGKTATIEADKILVGDETTETSTRTLDDTLYAIWWKIPYIKSLSFNLKNMNTQVGQLIQTADTDKPAEIKFNDETHSFYIVLPYNEEFYVNVFSLSVGTTTDVILNSKSNPFSSFGDIYMGNVTPEDEGYIEGMTHTNRLHLGDGMFSAITFGLKYIDAEKKFTIDLDEWANIKSDEATGIQMLELILSMAKDNLSGPSFYSSLQTFFIGSKDLGIADKFACNGLACTPHYGTKQVANINGNVYFFIAPTNGNSTFEASDLIYTVQYKSADDTLLYEMKVPKGSPLPDIRDADNKVTTADGKTYTISNWNGFNFDSPTYDDNNKTIVITEGTPQVNTTPNVIQTTNNNAEEQSESLIKLASHTEDTNIISEAIEENQESKEATLPPQAPEVVDENIEEEIPDNETQTNEQDINNQTNEEESEKKGSFPNEDMTLPDTNYYEKTKEEEKIQ